jgi:predicted DNA-binding antitoxin AbrB/MazE fold protein
MVEHVEAVYENGLLRPLGPVHLNESDRVLLSISKSEQDPMTEVLDHEFIAYARAEVAKMGTAPALEDVRQRLSKIEGSMSAVIVAERGDYKCFGSSSTRVPLQNATIPNSGRLK